MYVDTPICDNHSFIPGLNYIVFAAWKERGICNIGDLYVVSRLQYPCIKFFFRYLQVRDYVRKNMLNF